MNKIIGILMLLVCFAFTGLPDKPKGLKAGTMAPLFSLMDQNGSNTDLKTMLTKGPVVLIFYRGQWCPYCNKYLSHLEDSLNMIKAKGGQVLAISPEMQESIEQTVSKTKASYPVLHDAGLKVMKAYDVAFSVDTTTVARYKKFNIDFDKANGQNGANLPVPATYVIGTDGKIKYVFFNEDYKKRASVKEILEYL